MEITQFTKKIINISFKLNLFNNLNDATYLKFEYACYMGKKLNLDNPQTFNEKLQWLKLYDRKPIYTTMVDKYEAKKYVANIIGEEYIIPTLGVWDKFDDINFDELPDQFVLKCTHDSGGLVICKDKSKLDLKKAKKKINKSLKRNYYYIHREWPYKDVKPRIIAEKYMEDNKNGMISDYKLMVFNGNVKCTFVCTNRNTGNLNVTFFDNNWKVMPFERHYHKDKTFISKPVTFDIMKQFSENISKNLTFARIDFYEIDGHPYFGEITFFPGAGVEEFYPEEWDYKLGNMIQLVSINKKVKV